MKETKYVNVKTGLIDTKAGWELEYSDEKLKERRVSAGQAFGEDLEKGFLAEVEQ